MERVRLKSLRDVRIGNYKVIRKIGSGSFGDVYLGIYMHSGERVAIKVESTRVRCPQLNYERRLYKALRPAPGLPRMRYFCKEENFNALVMDMLGPSLESLFCTCSRAFTVKTVIMLADQMLRLLEYVHDRGFVHRDIKPDNFLMGLGGRNKQLFIIDFGLAKKYCDMSTGVHIPYCEDRSLTGTARYASIHAHQGIEQSRRDDLISMGYMLMYFVRGSLPWQGLKASTKQQKYERILEQKLSVSIEQLCEGYPSAFANFLNYSRCLEFTERPDYAMLRQQFYLLGRSLNCEKDNTYDWEMLKLKTHQNQPNPGKKMHGVPPKMPPDDGASGKPIVFNEKCNRWD